MFYVDEENVGHGEFFVKSMDCDCFYKARPSYYFGLNQEMGGLHANEKNCSLKKIYDEEQKTWMILRTRMDISKLVNWTDTLSLRTWCQEGYKLYGPRAIEAFDKATGEPVFSTLSWWVVMDLARKRPCKPNIFEDRLAPANKEKYYRDPVLPVFPLLEDFPCERLEDMSININYYDTDYNRHVNNISYVNWALDAFPKPFLDEYMPTVIDARWIKQSFLSDKLVVQTYSKDKENYLTRIVRDDEAVFECTTSWRRK